MNLKCTFGARTNIAVYKNLTIHCFRRIYYEKTLNIHPNIIIKIINCINESEIKENN